ncbi:MAG: DUF2867 domain-containing protein [Bifidobacteriaceae bacterium]|jgi:hypothetical protein|nr:DUF2867 domain-containing protein [Bifidobacteriaceae bacterium]
MDKRAVLKRPWRTGRLFTQHPVRPDFVDNWTTALREGDARSARAWADAVFTVQFRPVVALMRLRNALVRPLALVGRGPVATDLSGGLKPFAVLAQDEHEVVLGDNDSHLDFRVDLQVHPDFVSVATIVEIHNAVGRLYWSVVRLFHPVMVRALMRRVPTVENQGRGA